LGEPGDGIEDLVEVGQLQRPALDVDLDVLALRAHGATATSRTTWRGSLSKRRPWYEGARSWPPLVHSLNSTSHTSVGSTNRAARSGLVPAVKGDASRASGSKRRARSSSIFSVKPVP